MARREMPIRKRAHLSSGPSVQPAARAARSRCANPRIARLAAIFKFSIIGRSVALMDLDLDIRLIEPGDRLTGLSLGDAAFTPLKTFLQKHALEYERQSLARTYAAFQVEPRKVLGYMTLVCGEVVTDEAD